MTSVVGRNYKCVYHHSECCPQADDMHVSCPAAGLGQCLPASWVAHAVSWSVFVEWLQCVIKKRTMISKRLQVESSMAWESAVSRSFKNESICQFAENLPMSSMSGGKGVPLGIAITLTAGCVSSSGSGSCSVSEPLSSGLSKPASTRSATSAVMLYQRMRPGIYKKNTIHCQMISNLYFIVIIFLILFLTIYVVYFGPSWGSYIMPKVNSIKCVHVVCSFKLSYFRERFSFHRFYISILRLTIHQVYSCAVD